MRIYEIAGMPEPGNFHGNVDGADAAKNTDHTFDEATAYIKKVYRIAKKFRVQRLEPGFRAYDKNQKLKSQSVEKAADRELSLDDIIQKYQLLKNNLVSGAAQASPSLGYSWFCFENNRGQALFYYQDRGMGWDEITICAKDKQGYEELYNDLAMSGIIKPRTPKNKS